MTLELRGVKIEGASMYLYSIIFYFAVALTATDSACLHKGCGLSGGLMLRDLNEKIAEALHTSGNENNGMLKVMQWNILYDKRRGPDSWMNRRHEMCDYINAIKPDVLTLQEVMLNQLQDLRQCLPSYRYFGNSRDDRNNPLYNPIFVLQSKRINIIDYETFWLSRTPLKKGSRINSSREPRICSWVKLVLNGSVKYPVFVATTHLAYRAEKTAEKQIEILMTQMKEVIGGFNVSPLVVTGDFNWESNSSVYKTMEQFAMKNTMAEGTKTYPELSALPPYPGLIDYVWQRGLQSVFSAVMVDTRKNGRMLSDHRPVVAVVKYEHN